MPAPTLTLEQHSAIREEYASGVVQTVLAAHYDVGQSTISRVIRGEGGHTEGSAKVYETHLLRELGLKRCHRCRAPKPFGECRRNRANRDGLTSDCGECGRASARARHAANPGPGRARACQWQKDNPDAVRRKSRLASSRRRALIRGAFVEDVDPQVVFERDEGVCGLCHGAVDREEGFDVDHVLPLALGGEHSYRNTRLAHASCNRRRGRLVATTVAAIEGGR